MGGVNIKDTGSLQMLSEVLANSPNFLTAKNPNMAEINSSAKPKEPAELTKAKQVIADHEGKQAAEAARAQAAQAASDAEALQQARDVVEKWARQADAAKSLQKTAAKFAQKAECMERKVDEVDSGETTQADATLSCEVEAECAVESEETCNMTAAREIGQAHGVQATTGTLDAIFDGQQRGKSIRQKTE